jgi:hypothetical protein
MKVKLFDVYNSVNVMNKVLDAQLPISVSFQLTKLVKTLNEEVKMIEEERVKLVKKYSETDKDGESTVSEDKKQNFLKDFSELLETEVDLNWTPVSVSKLENLNVSVNELSKIQYLFSE